MGVDYSLPVCLDGIHMKAVRRRGDIIFYMGSMKPFPTLTKPGWYPKPQILQLSKKCIPG